MRRAEPLPDFDLYEALGVEPWASADAIRDAWRRGIAVGSAGAASAATARLDVASEWLLDPKRRARYDATRWPRGEREPLPDIDPLGAWPARRPRPRPPASFVPAVALIALIAWLAALVLDPVANPSSAGLLFALSTVILVAYGGWTLGRLLLRR